MADLFAFDEFEVDELQVFARNTISYHLLQIASEP